MKTATGGRRAPVSQKTRLERNWAANAPPLTLLESGCWDPRMGPTPRGGVFETAAAWLTGTEGQDAADEHRERLTHVPRLQRYLARDLVGAHRRVLEWLLEAEEGAWRSAKDGASIVRAVRSAKWEWTVDSLRSARLLRLPRGTCLVVGVAWSGEFRRRTRR